MSDPASNYTDPLEDALSHGAQRVAQLISLIAAGTEFVMRRNALKDAREADGTSALASKNVQDQESDAYQQARLRWAPAQDPRWLARADLLQTARAWSAAACYADTDPVAASAMRKCEERLRKLHPYAMARYDRLLGDGMRALDAMLETAPLFGRAPRARPGEAAAARPALRAPFEQDTSLPTDEAPATPLEPDPVTGQAAQAERRGWQIAAHLQARARAAGRDELGPDELEIVLETVTNLPHDVIEQITRLAADDRRVLSGNRSAGEVTATAGGDRTAAQITAESFPHSAADVVSAAAAGPGRPVQSPARAPAQKQERRPRRSV